MKKIRSKKRNFNQTVYALLTGRGGSTLRDKNVISVLGKPLLYYPAKAAYDSDLIHEYYVSSDSSKILKSAEQIGYTQIKRPKEISKPDSQHGDVIKHSLAHLNKRKKNPDIVLVLLANNATVKTEWIDDCIKMMLKDPSLTAVVPVYQDSDHHPFRAKKVDNKGLLQPFFDFKGKKVSTNRQDLEPSYFLCHNFWVLRSSNFVNISAGQQPWNFMGDRIKPYVVGEKTFDVHEREDVYLTEKWLRENTKYE